jgi:gliding motility-associated-like protein
VHSGKLLIPISLLISAFTLPALGQYDFTVDNTEGCTPMKVKYTLDTALVDTITSCYWDFGNGETSTLKVPDTVTYSNPGNFSPTLVFNNRADLRIEKPNLITAHHTVSANYIYYDTVTYNYYVLIHNEPLDAGVTYTFNWNIEEFGPRTGPRQEVNFPRIDTFTVALTVSDEFGCTSTVSHDIALFEAITVQNVFTPNGDNTNEDFIIISNGGIPLKLKIFSRAGILVYAAEGPIVTWDGTSAGKELKTGIYFYSIEALEGDVDKRYSKAGFLYLYR